MKANELMIGDWVQTPNGCRRVEELSSKNVIMEWHDYGCTVEDVLPIPLTADILNKNFPDTRYNVFWCWDDRKEGNELWFEIRIEGEDMEFRMDMRYVHELQHALRLCGIEKEIEL